MVDEQLETLKSVTQQKDKQTKNAILILVSMFSRRTEIPCDRCRIIYSSPPLAQRVQKIIRRNGGFADNLNNSARVEKPGFDLVVKIYLILVERCGALILLKEETLSVSSRLVRVLFGDLHVGTLIDLPWAPYSPGDHKTGRKLLRVFSLPRLHQRAAPLRIPGIA